MSRIDLLFITYNRLDYTRRALQSILADPGEEFSLTIWDNGSRDGTVEYLQREASDPRIREIVLSPENVGQTEAVNRVWSRSRADLVGKLDNDCLVTPGWTRTLAQAHADVPEFGVLACWHYFPDDFDYERARGKIQRFGKHRVLRHPWTCGTGLLLKREIYQALGPIRQQATTRYWLEIAAAGYVNGFYYPLIHQEHMDDPRSRYSHLKDEASYEEAKQVTFNLARHGQHTLADRWRWRRQVLDNLLEGPWEAKYYLGWRRRLLRIRSRMTRAARLA